MYLVKQTTRKNADKEFYTDSRFAFYQTKMYSTKWKHCHCVTDGNTQRYIYVWPTEEAYRVWYDDPTVTKYRQALEEHNKQNNIVFNEVCAIV